MVLEIAAVFARSIEGCCRMTRKPGWGIVYRMNFVVVAQGSAEMRLAEMAEVRWRLASSVEDALVTDIAWGKLDRRRPVKIGALGALVGYR